MENIFLKDIIPKKDTQQEEFLQKYPSYDGRGIKIAIIDSGVDVSLNGLQKTSTGHPKIIDCFDFTGNGYVDTSTFRRNGNDRYLTLLSGCQVKLPHKWKNPSDNWHLGIKPVKEIFPSICLNANANKIGDEKNIQMNKNEATKLNEIKDKYFTAKIYENESVDCIVWNDGQKWQACIISSDIKDLEDAKVLTNFRDSHEYCFIFGNVACCVTIHNDGNSLEILVPNLCHGSSVAQVSAAHFPGQPEKDGIAPGAQIISINVMGKTPDANTLLEALEMCIEMEVDIVNFSVGAATFNERIITEMFKQIVYEHGIIITRSAGNSGPFISSFKSYDLSNEIFYIGSIFSKDVASIFKEDVEDFSPFVWNYSSRGPLSNGARGVTAVVPADAIVENPKWNSNRKQIFDGTSCAAPNAAGVIACLLSGLKANKIQYSPAIIKMALSNTALLPDGGDRLGFGNGVIQINSAFEYLKTYKNNLPRIIFPQISLVGTSMKGIVFYKTTNNSSKNNYNIYVENYGKRIPWNLKLSPIDHNHIEHSKTVTSNAFNVKIDPTNLQPGNVYYSEIHGFHPLNFSLGPIFHFPITVIFPENVVDNRIHKSIIIQPPSIYKLILNPSKDNIKCTVKLYDSENGSVIFDLKEMMKSENFYENIFIPNKRIDSWFVEIKWEDIFEIYFFQFMEKALDLKCNLEIHFE